MTDSVIAPVTEPGEDDLIIERPDLQSWPRLLGSRLVTAAAWVIYVYLWLPMLTLLAWLAGIGIAYQQMIEYGGYQIALDMWTTFAIAILMLGSALLVWARINFYRFRGPDRRVAIGITDRDRLATEFALSPDQLGQLERCRRVRIDHYPNGDISRVEVPVAVATLPTSPDPPSLTANHP